MTTPLRILTAVLATIILGTAAVATDPQPTEGQAPQPALEASSYAYQIFQPRSYLASGKERWPLLIFLHGSGKRGSNLEKVKVNGPPKLLPNRPVSRSSPCRRNYPTTAASIGT